MENSVSAQRILTSQPILYLLPNTKTDKYLHRILVEYIYSTNVYLFAVLKYKLYKKHLFQKQ